jgi:hypothetical protein
MRHLARAAVLAGEEGKLGNAEGIPGCLQAVVAGWTYGGNLLSDKGLRHQPVLGRTREQPAPSAVPRLPASCGVAGRKYLPTAAFRVD